jgi:glycine oxidase
VTNPVGQRADTLIIGGGVIGCAVAYYLSKEKAHVVVLERGLIGGEASGAAAGMLAPLAEAHGPSPFLDLCLASHRLFPELADTLRAEVDVDVEYAPSGLLRVAFSEGEEAELRSHLEWQESLGMGVRWIDGEAARGLEPQLSPRLRGAVYSPLEHQVNPSKLVQGLARAAEARGAVIRQETPVASLLRRGARVTGVHLAGATLWADNVVLAAGPWTKRLAAALGVRVPVRPVRGQMLALGGGPSPVRHMIWGPRGYMAPKANGFLFVGATVEEVGFRKTTTTRGLSSLRRMANELVPALTHATQVDAWAAFRPGSSDGLPILGAAPGLDGLWVASGHFRNGILLSPITGRLMARSLLEGKEVEALSPFSPSRFEQRMGNGQTGG